MLSQMAISLQKSLMYALDRYDVDMVLVLIQ